MTELPHQGPHSVLISRKLIHECEAWAGRDLSSAQLGKLENGSFVYPDGSQEVFHDCLTAEQIAMLTQLDLTLRQVCNEKRTSEGRPTGLEGFQTHFRGLWGDPRRLYMLWYPDSTQTGLGDQSLLIVPGDWSPIMANEAERDCLSIAILMLRKPDDACRRHLAQIMADWLATVARGGVGNEGPVRPACEHVEWRGRAAFFGADFSRSGQQTLNWLTLWLVNHAEDCTIELISYGDPEAHLLQPSRKARPFHQKLPAPSSAAGGAVSPQGSRVRSPRVQLVRQASFRPERGVLQVAFSDPVQPEQAREIDRALKAWLLLGAHGGFEGHFHYDEPLEWDAGMASVRLRMDFGDADVETSSAVLEKVLENLSREVVHVESVVLS